MKTRKLNIIEPQVFTANSQTGAALAITLIMLTLLTLASVSMIQQNKTQTYLAGNAGEQIRMFVNAETLLSIAENQVEQIRFDDPSVKTACKTSNRIYEGQSINTGIANTTSTIMGVYCVDNNHEYRCVGNASYAPIDSSSQQNTDACLKLTNLQCSTEVYDIKTTLLDTVTKAERTLRSKYAIGCEVTI